MNNQQEKKKLALDLIDRVIRKILFRCKHRSFTKWKRVVEEGDIQREEERKRIDQQDTATTILEICCRRILKRKLLDSFNSWRHNVNE